MSLIQIQKQYERIPSFTCKTGCTDCCGPVPFTSEEWALLTPEEQAQEPNGVTCQFASSAGCQIYDRRPLMCRLFGTVDEERMRCPNGCKPDHMMSDQQGKTIVRHYHKNEFRPLRSASSGGFRSNSSWAGVLGLMAALVGTKR